MEEEKVCFRVAHFSSKNAARMPFVEGPGPSPSVLIGQNEAVSMLPRLGPL